MGKKTVNYSKAGINKLPNNKPALYRIKTASGNDNYDGVAGKGNVRDRIADHLDEIPGSRTILQYQRGREKRG